MSISGEDLKKWATSMGFSGNIPSQSFQKLLTPQNVQMWKHIMKHVRPKEEADTIRKNILLSKLRRNQLSGKNTGQLSVRISKVSQIGPAMEYENLLKIKKEHTAEIESEINRIQDLNQVFRTMGKKKKMIEKSIQNKRIMILALKEREKEFLKQLEFGSLDKQLNSLSLPPKEERKRYQLNRVNADSSLQSCKSSNMTVDSFCPQWNSSFLPDPSQHSPKVASVLARLENLDIMMKEFVPNGIFQDPSARRNQLHNYIFDHFQNVPASLLIESLTAKLQGLSRELALAATSEADLSDTDMDKCEIKSFEDRLRDQWQFVLETSEESAFLQNSALRKLKELEKKKEEVVKKALQTTNGTYREDFEIWVDNLVDNCLRAERIRVLEEENTKLEFSILSLEESCTFFHELDQAILECQHNIKCTMKEVQNRLNVIKKNKGMDNIKVLKNRIFKMIKDFQLKHKKHGFFHENSNPLLSLRDSVQTEVSQLVKLSAEHLQLVNSPSHIMQNPPLLSIYSPYVPVHLILQDNIEKFCQKRRLEELQLSPLLGLSIEDMIEETKSIESELELILKENIAELHQILKQGEINILQATGSISFWTESLADNFVPPNILVDGYNFKSLQSKFVEYLKED